MKKDALLSVKGLSTSFNTHDGVVRAIDGVDFEVFPGETLGLVGESGCGKSVTSLSVLRLLNPAMTRIQGQVMFDGNNLLDLSPDQMRMIRGGTISMIFQEPMTSLNPILTVGEQISESLRLHENLDRRAAREKAVQMLEMVQIPSPGVRVDQYPHKLSGGMRQRVMIAMALCCSPRLIFADEPTTALDVTIQAQILKLLNRLKKGSATSIVLITHDLGVVAQMASRVVVMYAGRIVEEAPVVPLFHDARHPYTRGLLNSVPVLNDESRNRLSEIPGIVPNLLRMPGGCSFHPRCPRAEDICRKESPSMTAFGDNRRVACWLADSKI
ncbi:ABC transporter ATP-binding protein [Desulfospira joergensenii]|uniref:ABC transporter ATP-binding protein n=1 Tax=Desulfospira joergensenii TaxID=53329 RepID=UPI0003B48E9A|nr:ABC transporter ATP-binding protein [Desulfospira joergensenii]